MSAINNRFSGCQRIGLRLVLVIAAGMAGGLMITAAQARPQVATVKYVSISFGELIRHYTNAYVAAGFYLDSEEAGRTGYTRTLLFKFKDPHYPGMTEGRLEIAFRIRQISESNACTPCYVHYVTAGNFGDDYSPAQRDAAYLRLMFAAAAARAKLPLVPLSDPRDALPKPTSPEIIRNN